MKDYNLSLYRSGFPFLATGRIWMNHAAVSPLSRRVHDAVARYLEQCAVEEIDTYLSLLPVAARLKANLGTIIGAPPERIAFVGNTSDGLNILASGLEWHAGDRIILNDSEFPTNIVPFINLKRLGVEIDFIETRHGEITADRLEKFVTPRTRLVSLSFVQFLSGFRADLEAVGGMCKKHNIIFCVDAIQGLGVSPLDVARMNIDFLSCGGPKWLMGLMGLGFIYVSEELQEQIHQAYAGWMSNRNFFGDFLSYRIDFDKSARRYENGTQNSAGIVALCESTTTLLDVGIDAIQAHLHRLTDSLIAAIDNAGFDVITPRDPSKRAGIVTFRCSGAQQLFESLIKENVVVSLREGMIRVSPHFYNSPDEAATFHSVLLQYRKTAAA
ncbi:MAG: aminotransferase class V-fold PLP-dependent enzyme [Bacteroidota bacterium]